jgi:hypothetical protein
LLEYAESHAGKGAGKSAAQEEEWRRGSVEDRLQHSLIKGLVWIIGGGDQCRGQAPALPHQRFGLVLLTVDQKSFQLKRLKSSIVTQSGSNKIISRLAAKLNYGSAAVFSGCESCVSSGSLLAGFLHMMFKFSLMTVDTFFNFHTGILVLFS